MIHAARRLVGLCEVLTWVYQVEISTRQHTASIVCNVVTGFLCILDGSSSVHSREVFLSHFLSFVVQQRTLHTYLLDLTEASAGT